MGIKVYKPTTNGRRNMTSLDFAEITTSTPEKSLLVALKSEAGRNNNGRITVRHQGGGHKRFYRLVDFKRNKDGVEAIVKTIEYDPNRSANIALYTTQTVLKLTSLLLKVLKLVNASFQVQKQISKLVTHFHLQTSQSVLLFTTSS